MPPKVRVTREQIIESTLRLVRQGGTDSINARSIAAELGCSTQPIFSNFSSMEELEEEVIRAAYECYFGFIKSEVESGKYPPYKAYGMAYIRFAKEEKQLFKLLLMRDRRGKDMSPTEDFSESVEMIMKSMGISRDKAEFMHLEMWVCVHGIGTMIATSFFEPEWDTISEMLSDVYNGLKERYLNEGKR